MDTYSFVDLVCMLEAVDLLVLLEHGVPGAGAHEVEVSWTAPAAATNGRTQVITHFTPLYETKEIHGNNS